MININKIVANSITITTGTSGHSETRFTLEGGTVETHDITGTLDRQWVIDNGYYDDNEGEWLKTITQADIGNSVTSIGDNAFSYCGSLTSVTIPDSVMSIGYDAFIYCASITHVYCYPNPANLTWNEDGKDDFNPAGPDATSCHVKAEYLTEYQTKFGDEVNVTFVGDLT